MTGAPAAARAAGTLLVLGIRKSWDMWVALGFIAQMVFFSRFFVQWIASERKGESTFPIAFWYLSIAGGLLLLVYSVHIKDPVFIMGQSCGLAIYARNLALILRKRRRGR